MTTGENRHAAILPVLYPVLVMHPLSNCGRSKPIIDPEANATEPSYVLSVFLQYVHSGLRLQLAAVLGAVDLSAPLVHNCSC